MYETWRFMGSLKKKSMENWGAWAQADSWTRSQELQQILNFFVGIFAQMGVVYSRGQEIPV